MNLSTTKMSSKGQVVIPEDIRKKLHLDAGTQFVVIAEKDVVIFKVIAVPKLSDFNKMADKVSRQARAAGLTPQDIDDAIQEVRKK